MKDRMQVLQAQQYGALARKNGWTLDFAKGFLSGEHSRLSSTTLSIYALVGLNDYCQGLRAGYFVREDSAGT